MKRILVYTFLLLCLSGALKVLNGQETRVSGTIKLHPWVNLPVVLSTDLKGGLQSLGILNLTATPVTVLNTKVPAFKRETGMIASVIDADTGNSTRYFEYLGSDIWREVFVINGWEPAHLYATGDYVAYNGNFYVANSAFTSDATTFATDVTKWNNAGGKDGKYTVSELKMDAQTLSKVAITGTSVLPADADKTIATVGFVNSGDGSGSIDANRNVTRSGLTGITGQNFGSTTVADFLNKLFFPTLAATPPTSTFSTATTTFPYSTWKSWPSYTSNLSFSWSVTNVSQTDDTDDKLITSIKLKSGATELATVPSPTGTNQSGTFSSIPLQNTNGNVTTDFAKTYTLEVIDAQPNTVNKNIVVTMSKAIRLTYGVPALTPSTTAYEYDLADKTIAVSWSVAPNDETITAITVDGASAGSTATTGSKNVTFLAMANGGVQSKAFPLIVTGNLYGPGSTQNSATVSWQNRLYRGVITSATPPCNGSFTFTDTQVKALSTETKLGGNWKVAAGYDFVCDVTGQYAVFAYPDDSTTPTVQYWDSNFNVWQSYQAGDIKIIDRANFMNQNGYSGTNYKLVFICVKYTSATVKIRLQ